MFAVVKDFVKDNLWPELVPELKSVVMSSDIVGTTMHSQWNTINALLLLQSIVKQFQYFLNPKSSKGDNIAAIRVDCKRYSYVSAFDI